MVRMNVPSPLQNIFTCDNETAVDACTENLHPNFVDMQFKAFSTLFENRTATSFEIIANSFSNSVDTVTFYSTIIGVLSIIWMITNLIFFAFGINLNSLRENC